MSEKPTASSTVDDTPNPLTRNNASTFAELKSKLSKNTQDNKPTTNQPTNNQQQQNTIQHSR